MWLSASPQMYTPVKTVIRRTAASNGSSGSALLKKLLAEGAIVEARDTSGTTPLMAAIRAGCGENVRMLRDCGASLNGRDNEDDCAILIAVKCRNVSIAELLLDAGASLNVKDNRGRTPT
ncbi:ankyrin repeat-containing domain protein [Aspergillus filifer]